MLPLKEFKEGPVGFPSLINYFGLVEEGVMINKDGSFMSCFYYCGPDMDSSIGQEHDALAAQVNAVLIKLGSGWMINVDSIRIAAVDYPDNNHFTDPTSQLIEEERKRHYQKEGNHFESVYVLTLTYKPSVFQNKRLKKILISSDEKDQRREVEDIIDYFQRAMADIEAGLGARLSIKRLSSKEILTYLQSCILGRSGTMAIPNPPAYLNHLLGAYDFVGGTKPRIDGNHIGVVAIIEFPHESYSGILNVLNRLPFKYRFSSRFIIMDPVDAEKELKKVRTHLHNKQFDLITIVSELMSPGSGSKYGNNEARQKALEADDAVTEARDGIVRYGYYTGVVVIIEEDRKICEERTKEIKSALNNSGFPARIEEGNAIEAYLGSIPGHGYPNVRRPLINSLNMAHFMPLTNVWAGLEKNPNPKFPKDSPPLFYAATSGATPFRFNIHVSDVGHTLVLGPTGSGKSTLLALINAQFLRYKNAQIFAFDKRFSQYVLVQACRGNHYNILNKDNKLSFCPLAEIDSDADRIWACSWIEELLILQGMAIDPKARNDISEGVEALRSDESRTLSSLHTNIQNMQIKEALEPFVTIKGGVMASLLDAEEDGLAESNFQVFEIENLLNMDKRHAVPVLTYLFHMIEKRLDGRPALIIIDEAWIMLDHPLFKEKIKEWLLVLRKANASVIFATQSISDICNSSIKDVIIESCPTKIFLPNPGAMTPNSKPLYESFGLNDRQISIISTAIPKRQYYFTSPLGRRLIELDLGPAALKFTGVNDDEGLAMVRKLEQEHPKDWPAYWLRMNNLHEEEKIWRKLYFEGEN